jgi:hypothetical protein
MPEGEKPPVMRQKRVLKAVEDPITVPCSEKVEKFIQKRIDAINGDIKRLDIERSHLEDRKRRLEAKKLQLQIMLKGGTKNDTP